MDGPATEPVGEPRSLAPGPEVQSEGLLENDLYLLTGQAEAQEKGRRRRGREPRVPAQLALPPAPAPEAPEAPEAAGEREERLLQERAGEPQLALPAPGDEAANGEHPEAPEDDPERARKRKKFESKPVEARREEGDDSEWIWFPSLAAAGRETGAPNGSIASLCTMQGSHSGWQFRWPGSALLEKPPPRRVELPSEEVEVILRRLRAMSGEERRVALAAMPEGTRKELMKHLKQEAGGSRLRQLLSHLPDLLEGADDQKRTELLQGVRMLEAVNAQVLAAPDMAAVVRILRELTPLQRHAIVEALPAETQQALTAHLRAEKAAHSAPKAYPAQSLLPALCRMR